MSLSGAGPYRRTLLALAGAMMLPAAGIARAETYPSRPVQIVVPYPPGGTADLIARFLADRLREARGQSFVVENRAGATGTIGSASVARAPADGYTLLIGVGGPLTIAPHLMPNIPYDTMAAFDPITLVAEVPSLLAVHPNVPARTVQELIALARARPGALNFGSAGTGSSVHLAGELFKLSAGIQVEHVPYRGGAPALNDLIAGNITYLFENLPQLLPHAETGRIRALGITSTRRSASLPDVPTVAEAGVPGFEATTWFGLLGPRGLPPEVRQQLHADVTRVLGNSEVRGFLARQGADVVGNTPEEFAAFMRRDSDRWRDVIRRANIRLD